MLTGSSSSSTMHRISVLIQAKNEEKNIGHALESCRWAREIFVVDNFSTDATVEIVRAYTNTQLTQRDFDGYAAQKNWALSSLPISGDWVLILDADETVPDPLASELQTIARNPDAPECWYVNRRFIFLGKWIKHCGWYPSWNLRFFKKGFARYEERAVDEHMIASGRISYLKHDLIHDDHRGLEQWIAKHNQYSSLEAHERVSGRESLPASLRSKNPVGRKRAMKNVFYRLPGRPLIRFVAMYFFQFGFLDGYPGFVFCVLRAIQEFHISIKIKEMRNGFPPLGNDTMQ